MFPKDMDKVILTDVDGCLLNWEYAFHVWMSTRGHQVKVEDKGLHWNISSQYGISNEESLELVTIFNESAAIGFLPPLRDAVDYVHKLHFEHGFIFHAISSLSDDENAGTLRRMNLDKIFGESIFEHVQCLPICSPKKDYLSQFIGSGYFWVEDSIENAEDGLELGLRPLLMSHGYTMNYVHADIPVVKNWAEAYSIIV